MSKSISLASIAGAVLVLCALAMPAHAQATRTWVSGVGDDANPCSRTAPCKTFAGAISKTATFGEINCLDPGGFGAVTITKSIIISCEAGTAGVLVSGTNGIVINVASTDVVYLRGLDFEGLTTGLSGILFLGAGTLHVEHCLIRKFNSASAGMGISVATSGPSKLFVMDSYITDNGSASGGGGMVIRPTTAGVNAVLKNVYVDNNAGIGVKVDGTGGTGTVNLMVVDSVVSASAGSNIAAFTTPGTGTANVMIDRTSLSASGLGVRSDGAATTVRIGNSQIFGNVNGVFSANGGTLQSYGNNQLNGNTNDGTMSTIGEH
jgi:hypothetical protein